MQAGKQSHTVTNENKYPGLCTLASPGCLFYHSKKELTKQLRELFRGHIGHYRVCKAR
jgi:hypothetical protein